MKYALLLVPSIAFADPRVHPFTATGDLPATGEVERRANGLGVPVGRGDQLWLGVSYGNPNQPTFVFDTRKRTWSKHMTSKYTATYKPAINVVGPGMLRVRVPPPPGRAYTILFNQQASGPGRWGYSLVVHDWAHDTWTELTSLLRPPTGDGTMFHHEIGDKFVQLAGTSSDGRNYGGAQVIDVATGKASPLFATPPPEVTQLRYYFAWGISDHLLGVVGGASVLINMNDQQRLDKARTNAVKTGWIHDLATGTTRAIPAPPVADAADLIYAEGCFVGHYFVYGTRGAHPVETYVLDAEAANPTWQREPVSPGVCQYGIGRPTVSVDRAAHKIVDVDLATGKTVEVAVPADASGEMITPDGDKLVLPPTATWRGGFYSRKTRKWTELPTGLFDADGYVVVGVTDRALVLWGARTQVKTIKGGGCGGPRAPNQGCDPVSDQTIDRVDPKGFVVDL